ncbi:hypothetical protein D3C86_1859000 [compost metagenome]
MVPADGFTSTEITRAVAAHCVATGGVTEFSVITGVGVTPSNSNAPKSGAVPVPVYPAFP